MYLPPQRQFEDASPALPRPQAAWSPGRRRRGWGILRLVTRTFLRACARLITAGAGAAVLAAAGAPAAAATEVADAPQWQWPLPGQPRVIRGFDPPATAYGAGHRGVDLAGRPGLAVLAAGSGSVGYAGMLAGRGVVTVLHAGGLRTTYEPVIVSVRPGDRIAAGAVLGGLAPGHAGCPVPACLHWGLLRGETYLDPLALLGVGRVRLLPLDGRAPRPAGTSAAAALVSTATAGSMLLWCRVRRKQQLGSGGRLGCRSRRGPVSAGRPSWRAVE